MNPEARTMAPRATARPVPRSINPPPAAKYGLPTMTCSKRLLAIPENPSSVSVIFLKSICGAPGCCVDGAGDEGVVGVSMEREVVAVEVLVLLGSVSGEPDADPPKNPIML